MNKANVNVRLCWWENTSEWEEQYNDSLLDFLSMQPKKNFFNEGTIHLCWNNAPERFGTAVCLQEIDAGAEKAACDNVDGESFDYNEQFEIELFTWVLENILLTLEPKKKAHDMAHHSYWDWREKLQLNTYNRVLSGLKNGLIKIQMADIKTDIVSIGDYLFNISYSNLTSFSVEERADIIAYTLNRIRMDCYTEYAYCMAYLEERDYNE